MWSKAVSTKFNLKDRSIRTNARLRLNRSLDEVKHPLKEHLRSNDGYTPTPYGLADIPVTIAVTTEEMTKQGIRDTGNLPHSQALPLPYAMRQEVGHHSLAIEDQSRICVSPIGPDRPVTFNGFPEKLKVADVLDCQVYGQGVPSNASIGSDKPKPIGLSLSADILEESLIEFPLSPGFRIAANGDRVPNEKIKNGLAIHVEMIGNRLRTYPALVHLAGSFFFCWRESFLAFRAIAASYSMPFKRTADHINRYSKSFFDRMRAHLFFSIKCGQLPLLVKSQTFSIPNRNFTALQCSINGRPRNSKTSGYGLASKAFMLIKEEHFLLLFRRQNSHAFNIAHCHL